MKRFIFLFVILIATLVLSLIYREEAPMRLFAAELVFLFIVHLFAVINALLIRFNGWQTPARINLGNTENEKIEVFFSGGMFPFPVKGVMKFEVCNTRLKDGKALIDIPFSMSAGRKTIVFPVVMLNAGLLQLRPVSAVFFEATGLIGIKKKIREKERSILIYPESFSLLVNNEKGIDFSLGNDDSEFYTDRPGDDPSEVFDRREFRNGDKLSRVDWKLSAREKKIMVKEMSAPIPEPVCLILGLAKGAAEKINSCMSLFYSVSLALNSEKIRFSVMIPGGIAGSYEILHVKDDETLSEAMTKLLCSKPMDTYDLSEMETMRLFDPYSMAIYITAEEKEADEIGKTKMNDKLMVFCVTGSKKRDSEKVSYFDKNELKDELKNFCIEIK